MCHVGSGNDCSPPHQRRRESNRRPAVRYVAAAPRYAHPYTALALLGGCQASPLRYSTVRYPVIYRYQYRTGRKHRNSGLKKNISNYCRLATVLHWYGCGAEFFLYPL
jgi:hypothetical protein